MLSILIRILIAKNDTNNQDKSSHFSVACASPGLKHQTAHTTTVAPILCSIKHVYLFILGSGLAPNSVSGGPSSPVLAANASPLPTNAAGQQT